MGMSGGVDSSVTAKLMLDQVGDSSFVIPPLPYILDVRATMSPEFTCAIGTPETSPAPTKAANGKRTGTTSSEYASY